MDELFLWQVFDSNASGGQNAWAQQQGLPDPYRLQMPLILGHVSEESLATLRSHDGGPGAVPGGPPQAESRGRLFNESDPGAITLLDQQAGPGLTYREFTPPPPAPPPEPDVEARPIGPGAILGRWQAVKGAYCHSLVTRDRDDYFIDFQRGGRFDRYLGRRTGGDRFHVRSERQKDPFTMEYDVVWRTDEPALRYVDNESITITVTSGTNGATYLCRGGRVGVTDGGYVRVGR